MSEGKQTIGDWVHPFIEGTTTPYTFTATAKDSVTGQTGTKTGTFSVNRPGPTPTLVGSTVATPKGSYSATSGGALDWPSAVAFDQLVFAGSGLPTTQRQMAQVVQKAYFGDRELPANVTSGSYDNGLGDFGRMGTFINTHGGKILLSIRAGSVDNGGYQDAAFTTTVKAMIAAYGTNWKYVMYQEPNGGSHYQVFPVPNPDPNNPQSYGPKYVTYAQHYYELFHSILQSEGVDGQIPAVWDPIVGSGAGAPATYKTFYPGDNYVDEVMGDAYLTGFYYGSHGLYELEQLANNNVNGPVPLGLAEWGWSANNPPAWGDGSLWKAYVQYLLTGKQQTYTDPKDGSTQMIAADGFTGFANRRAQGMKNGWFIWWAGHLGFPPTSAAQNSTSPGYNGNDWPGFNCDNPCPMLPQIVAFYQALAV